MKRNKNTLKFVSTCTCNAIRNGLRPKGSVCPFCGRVEPLSRTISDNSQNRISTGIGNRGNGSRIGVTSEQNAIR